MVASLSAAAITPGFWREAFDSNQVRMRLRALKRKDRLKDQPAAPVRYFSISEIGCLVKSLFISARTHAFTSEWNAFRNSASVLGGATTTRAFVLPALIIRSMAEAIFRAKR